VLPSFIIEPWTVRFPPIVKFPGLLYISFVLVLYESAYPPFGPVEPVDPVERTGLINKPDVSGVKPLPDAFRHILPAA
jgi:hypothetical protein